MRIYFLFIFVATYAEARKKTNKAQNTSDLTSDPEDYGRGRRAARKRVLSDEEHNPLSSDEENIPVNTSKVQKKF